MISYTQQTLQRLWKYGCYWVTTCTRQSLSHYWFIWTLFLQSNNDILLPTITHRIPPLFTLSSDNAGDVQRKALEHFRVTTFTSYTELRPEDYMVMLVLRKKDNPAGKTIKGKKKSCFHLWGFFYKESRWSTVQKPTHNTCYTMPAWDGIFAVIFIIIIIIITLNVLFYIHNVLCCNLNDPFEFSVLSMSLCLVAKW